MFCNDTPSPFSHAPCCLWDACSHPKPAAKQNGQLACMRMRLARHLYRLYTQRGRQSIHARKSYIQYLSHRYQTRELMTRQSFTWTINASISFHHLESSSRERVGQLRGRCISWLIGIAGGRVRHRCVIRRQGSRFQSARLPSIKPTSLFP